MPLAGSLSSEELKTTWPLVPVVEETTLVDDWPRLRRNGKSALHISSKECAFLCKTTSRRVTYFVARPIQTKIHRGLRAKETNKEGVYAISMGIIHGNVFEHGLRVCHFVACNNLGFTNLRLCGIGGARVPDYLHFYSDLDPAFLPVAANL